MIRVITGKFNNLEYDVRGIAMSFYPGVAIAFDSEGELPAPSQDDVTLDLEKIFDKAICDECADSKDFDGVTVNKNNLRKCLYNHLKEQTGKELPWGILIGIRPTKIALSKLQSGATIPEAAKHFQEEYFVSPSKSVLASTIAAREIDVVKQYSHAKNSYSLYAGVPFCPSRCLYCSFASQPIALWENRTGEYVDAVKTELDASIALMETQKRICNSIYVGGGTPTALPLKEFERFIKMIAAYKEKFGNKMEFTVEAGRPDSITPEKLAVMSECGVNRISINPQSMSDATLERIGRSHNARQITEAFEMARANGFDNINMDIILGLPGEMPDDVKHTISEIAKLRPESLTVHSLAVKRAARLNMESEGVVMPGPSEELVNCMMDIARVGAAEMGMNPYYMYRQKNMAGNLENVGFAVPGKECYYNIVMMEEMESILAVGAGTVSKLVRADGTIERCDCHKDPKLYIEDIQSMIKRKEKLFME